MFLEDLKQLFQDTLKCIFENDQMSYSQRLADISLIFKKGDQTNIKNYRPISLTNTDYKIIAFVFARRLQKVIDNLINENQSAYIKGRYIEENARIILDLFDYCVETNNEGIFLFLDFEKAFDSIEWIFLFKTLEKYKFSNNFIKWMKILYNNPMFRIKNNGWNSKTCYMSRGIRQGCPISAILYLFVADVLALKVKNNDQILGIKPSNYSKEFKHIQHADDLTLFLRNRESLKEAIKTIKDFLNMQGLN